MKVHLLTKFISRTRKTRCDGAKPVCYNCQKRPPEVGECSYEGQPKRRGQDKQPGTRVRASTTRRPAKRKRVSDGGENQESESDSVAHRSGVDDGQSSSHLHPSFEHFPGLSSDDEVGSHLSLGCLKAHIWRIGLGGRVRPIPLGRFGSTKRRRRDRLGSVQRRAVHPGAAEPPVHARDLVGRAADLLLHGGCLDRDRYDCPDSGAAHILRATRCRGSTCSLPFLHILGQLHQPASLL